MHRPCSLEESWAQWKPKHRTNNRALCHRRNRHVGQLSHPRAGFARSLNRLLHPAAYLFPGAREAPPSAEAIAEGQAELAAPVHHLRRVPIEFGLATSAKP